MTRFVRPAVQKLETSVACCVFDSGSSLVWDVPPQPLSPQLHSISPSVFT